MKKVKRQKFSVEGETLTPSRLTGLIALLSFAFCASFGLALFKVTPNGDFLLNVVTIPAFFSVVIAAVVAATAFTDSDTKGRRRRHRSRRYPHFRTEVAAIITSAGSTLDDTQEHLDELDSPPAELVDTFNQLVRWEGDLIRAAGEVTKANSPQEVSLIEEMFSDFAMKALEFSHLSASLLAEQKAERAQAAHVKAAELAAGALIHTAGAGQAAALSFEEARLRVTSTKKAQKEIKDLQDRISS